MNKYGFIIKVILFTIIALTALSGAFIVVADGDLERTLEFSGALKYQNGDNVSAGARICAYINGELRGSLTTAVDGRYGVVYPPHLSHLAVIGNSADNGKNITFKVDGVQFYPEFHITYWGTDANTSPYATWNLTATTESANIVYSNLNVAPISGTAPLKITANATVANTGGVAEDYNATLKVDGAVVNYTTGTLPVGENVTVSFTHTLTSGTYNVTIDELTATLVTVSEPPTITSWGNDKTNDGSLHITLNASESVRFSATADQTITTWNWFKDGAAQSNTSDNYTTSWSVSGTYTVSVNATNANGTSDTKTWTVTIKAEPSPCYIATATYGTPLDSRIDILRDFRDELLLTNPIGAAFVSTYYRTSPPIADALRENDRLRTVTRLTLIAPLVYLSKFALNGILLVFIFGLAVGILLIREQDRNGFLRSLLVGVGSILVFIAAIFSLGFIGYAIPFCAGVGAYLLPFVIPVSLGLAVGTVWKRKRETTSSSLHFGSLVSSGCGDKRL